MNLRKRSDMIQQNLEKMFDLFKEEHKKVVPKFQDSIVALETDLALSDINKKES